MMTWEYLLFRRSSTEADDEWLGRMNRLGAEGWEAVFAAAGGVLMKRPR